MSDRKSESARRNGAKSQGPATPQGRARSAQNSLKHGLNAATVVLPHEDPQAFAQLRQSYLDAFHPANRPQADLVEALAAARWRLNRLLQMESDLFEKELCREDIAADYDQVSGQEKMAFVFDELANRSKSLALLIRYEGHLNRIYDRAFRQFQALQKAARPPAGETVRNEPKPPAPRHPAAVPAPPPAPADPPSAPPAASQPSLDPPSPAHPPAHPPRI